MRLAAVTRFVRGADAEEKRTFARDLIERLDDLSILPGEHFLIAHPDALKGEHAPRPGVCQFCEEPINANTAYRFVQGWERPRSEGGTNALALREPFPDTFACSTCIDRLKRGISPTQGTLT